MDNGEAMARALASADAFIAQTRTLLNELERIQMLLMGLAESDASPVVRHFLLVQVMSSAQRHAARLRAVHNLGSNGNAH